MDSRVKAAFGGGIALLLAGGVIAVMLGEDDAPADVQRPVRGGGSSGSATHPSAADSTAPDPGDARGSGVEVPGADPRGDDGEPQESTAGPRRPPPRGGPGVIVGSDAGPVAVEFRCVDASGAPLAGVWVEAKRQSGAPLPPATSDANGIARIGGLPTGERISGVGRHATSSQGAAFGPIKVGARTIVTLRFEGSELGRLSGHLVDDQGQPVTDAELILVNPKREGKVVLDALGMSLRGDGSFLAEVGVGTYTVSARGPGFTESDRTYVVVEVGAEAGPLTLVLSRAGSISGVVKLPPELQSRFPLDMDLVSEVRGGTEENPYTRTRRAAIEIGSGRTFRLEDCEPGRYRIRLEVPQRGSPRVGPWAVLVLSPGQHVKGVSLTLAEVLVAVQGVARDDQGVALEGVRVTIGPRAVTTDAEGRYAIRGLDLGDTFLEGKLVDHAISFNEISYQGAALTVDLVLARLGGVRGVARGAEGPIEVLVVFKEEDGVRPYDVQTDGSGAYLLEGLPPGDYYLKAGPGADAFDDVGAPTVRVVPGRVVEAPPVSAE